MKICTNCAYENCNIFDWCAQCKASLKDAIPVKWYQIITAQKIMKEVRANAEVFGKYVEPPIPSKTIAISNQDVEPKQQTNPVKLTSSPIKSNKQQLKEHMKELDRQGVAYCPKCYSTSLSADKKGFGVGKAVVGAVVAAPLFAPIGLIAGNINAKKVRITCLKCGHNWLAGK